jgi:tetratricopeptide (TPR) repeat protein
MRRLLEHLSGLAETVEPRLSTSEQTDAVRRLESELDNTRAALGWALAQDRVDLALRLSTAMGRFWVMGDHVVEGDRWVAEALDRSDGSEPSLRARALVIAGNLSHYLDDQDRAQRRYEDARHLANELGDETTLAYALNGLGNVADERDQVALAVELNSAALELFRAAGDERGIRVSLNNLGERAMRLGDSVRARELLHEAIELSRDAGDIYILTSALEVLGVIALGEGRPDAASMKYRELLEAALAAGFKRTVTYGLAGLSAAASLEGVVERSGFLWGAVERIEEDQGFPIHGTERLRYERHVRRMEASDPAAFALAVRDGRAATSDEAIARALELD